jgi:ABC-type transporter Mla maintaining outer membrane lipid asymmetry ATPase subunit MlaF
MVVCLPGETVFIWFIRTPKKLAPCCNPCIETRSICAKKLILDLKQGVEERLPSELSGGMKKRVALARAIISNDKRGQTEQELVMYDEPTAGLDPIASTVVEDLIRSVHINGRDAMGKPGTIASYLVVTHQHSTIRRAVDRILFLHGGKVVWEGTTADFDNSTNPIVRQFVDGSLRGPIRY